MFCVLCFMPPILFYDLCILLFYGLTDRAQFLHADTSLETSLVPLTSCILELLKGKGKAQSIRLEIRLFKPPLEAVQHHLGWFDAL